MSNLLLTGCGPSNGGGAPPIPFDGPFDGLDATNLWAAICPGHRLYGASDPDVVTIRRLSDNASQNFKATAGTLGVDVAAFCGGADGTVLAGIDQGPLGNNIVPSGNGPRIFTGGALVALGAGVAPDFGFAGAVTSLRKLAATIPNPFSVVMAFQMDVLASRGLMAASGGSGGNVSIPFSAANLPQLNAGTGVSGSPALVAGTKYVGAFRFNGAASSIRINGAASLAIGNAGTNAITGATLAFGAGVPLHSDGRIGAIVVFTENISDAKAAAYEAALATIFGSFP